MKFNFLRSVNKCMQSSVKGLERAMKKRIVRWGVMLVTQVLSRQVRKRYTHDRVIRIRQSTHFPEKQWWNCALHFAYTLYGIHMNMFLLYDELLLKTDEKKSKAI